MAGRQTAVEKVFDQLNKFIMAVSERQRGRKHGNKGLILDDGRAEASFRLSVRYAGA
jgi:hypothetical protein